MKPLIIFILMLSLCFIAPQDSNARVASNGESQAGIRFIQGDFTEETEIDSGINGNENGHNQTTFPQTGEKDTMSFMIIGAALICGLPFLNKIKSKREEELE